MYRVTFTYSTVQSSTHPIAVQCTHTIYGTCTLRYPSKYVSPLPREFSWRPRRHVRVAPPDAAMPALVLAWVATAAVLKFDARTSSIVFDNKARLTTTCPESECASLPPPPPLAPRVVGMAPRSFAPIYTGAKVKLRLRDVPLSCVGALANQPCALPYDDVDEPNFYCNWNRQGPRTEPNGDVLRQP